MTSTPDDTPLIPPPAGQQSNFIDPVSDAYIVRIPTYALLPTMLIFVGSRLVARIMVTRSFGGADDYMCIIATILVTTWCGMSLSLLNHPHGHHMWDVPVSAVTDVFLKKTYAIDILYICSSATVRSSIFNLYLRLFGHAANLRKVILAGLVITIACYTALLVAHIYYCSPRPEYGGWSMEGFERCTNPDIDISITQAVFGSVTDVFLLLLPVVQVMRLHMPLRKRLGVAAIFMSGLLALASSLACAVLRIYLLHETDLFWEVTKIYALSTVEVTVGIICCCMPVIPSLARRAMESKVWSTMSSRLPSWTWDSSRKRVLREERATAIAAQGNNGGWLESRLSSGPSWAHHQKGAHQQPLQGLPSMGRNQSYLELESLDGR